MPIYGHRDVETGKPGTRMNSVSGLFCLVICSSTGKEVDGKQDREQEGNWLNTVLVKKYSDQT